MKNDEAQSIAKKSTNVKDNRRTRLACDECHKRRIKCDGLSPCGTCIRNLNYCTVSRKILKRGPKAGHIEFLESRVKLLESLLTPEQKQVLEQINSKTNYMAEEQDDMQSLREISDDDLRLDLIALYFNHVHHKIPFLHEHTFMHNIRGHRNCLLYMMYALGSIYQDFGGMEHNSKAGDFYYELARNEIDELKVDVADYHVIGAYLLLFKYCKGSGRMSKGTIFYSRGCALLLKSRFNEDLFFYPGTGSSQKITETDREIRRRLFWLYYEYGLYAAFVLGHPPLLPEDIYRGILPMDDESFNLVASLERKYGPSYFVNNLSDDHLGNKSNPMPFPLEDIEGESDGLQGPLTLLMRIMKVFEKIMLLNRSYFTSTMDKEKIDILRSQIDESLLNWNKAFQIWLAKDSFLILANKSSLPTVPWMSTFLEVVYHFCIISVHRPLIVNSFLESRTESVTLFTHPSCSIVERSASSISAVVQQNDFANFFINTPSFTHTILFHLGLTYGMLLYFSPHSPNCNRYIREINSCISALSTISRYFSPTRNKWDILRRIASTFYRKKTEEELESQLELFRESILQGYPLIGPYVSPEDIEEYTKARQILGTQRFKI